MEINPSEIITVVLAVAGLITAVGGAATYIRKWYSEGKAAKNSVIIQEHTEQLRSIDGRLKALEASNTIQEQYANAMCETMLALLDHSITGNSIEKLKKARDELNAYIIHRGEG